MEERTYVIKVADKEELTAALEAVKKVRQERERAERLAKAEESINHAVNVAIASVGIANVKSIIRKINQELREI